MRRESDEGFTLLDTLMATTVMMVVMAVFTTSILSMYQTANLVDAKSQAQSQLNVAMQRLDHEVRYAKGISVPYTVDGNPYVDFLIVTVGRQQCMQLRVQDGVLAQRSWTYQANPVDFTPWTALASGVTGSGPFLYTEPSANLAYQQLTVSLTTSAASSPATAGSADVNLVTFTALNSTRVTGNNYCSAGR